MPEKLFRLIQFSLLCLELNSKCRSGADLVVSVLSFYYDNHRSKPTEDFLGKIVVFKERKSTKRYVDTRVPSKPNVTIATLTYVAI